MRPIAHRGWLVALVAAAACAHPLAVAFAQSPLGIGVAEPALPSSGVLSPFLNWVNANQQQFYRSLTGALKAMRADGAGLPLLVGLSFAYGVFHAAGPGHGKAVISSYMLANEVALRRGILLSFVSAMLQALTAIAVIGLVFLVLRGTLYSMTDATYLLEIASYAIVTAFGAWLLWRKLAPRHALNMPHSLSGAATADHHHHHDHGEVCAGCGHVHAPDPKLLSGERFEWRTAWSAIMAVGLRPCSGALIVLSFAFLNGVWAGGILSVFAMALGTGITVSVLAILAVTAKNWAVLMAGDGSLGAAMHRWIEIAGAAFVLILGLLLLASSLTI